MKILLKTLKNASFEIEVDSPSSTVLDIKKNAESKLNADSASIKLVFNGNVLVDDKTLSFYNIKEGSVIVTMTTKVNSNVKKVDVNNDIDINKKDVVEEKNKSNNQNGNQNNNQNVNQQSNVVKNYDDQVKQLLDMGFEKSQCEKAISAAQGSIPIAIEYLYSGIPQNLGLSNNNNNNNSSNNNNNNPLLSGVDIDEELDNYVNGYVDEENANNNEIDSEFLNNIDLQDPNALSKIASVLKVIVKEDPMLLQEILMDIEENSPQVINYIKEHETQFKAEMEKPISEDDYKLYDSLVGGVGAEYVVEGDEGEEGEDDEENGEDPFKDIIKDFTPEDNKSIDNLVAMGFSRGDAIQAYIACDKNEQNATNFLLQDKYN